MMMIKVATDRTDKYFQTRAESKQELEEMQLPPPFW